MAVGVDRVNNKNSGARVFYSLWPRNASRRCSGRQADVTERKNVSFGCSGELYGAM
jgi:hypothetical protein